MWPLGRSQYFTHVCDTEFRSTMQAVRALGLTSVSRCESRSNVSSFRSISVRNVFICMGRKQIALCLHFIDIQGPALQFNFVLNDLCHAHMDTSAPVRFSKTLRSIESNKRANNGACAVLNIDDSFFRYRRS